MDGSSEIVEALSPYMAWVIGRVHARRKGTYLLIVREVEEGLSAQIDNDDCEEIVSKLSLKLGKDNVRYDFREESQWFAWCIIDFRRPDTVKAFKGTPEEREYLCWGSLCIWESYVPYMGVYWSDIAVPLDKVDEKIRQLRELGFTRILPHRYYKYNVAHIHFTGDIKDVDKFVEVLVS